MGDPCTKTRKCDPSEGNGNYLYNSMIGIQSHPIAANRFVLFFQHSAPLSPRPSDLDRWASCMPGQGRDMPKQMPYVAQPMGHTEADCHVLKPLNRPKSWCYWVSSQLLVIASTFQSACLAILMSVFRTIRTCMNEATIPTLKSPGYVVGRSESKCQVRTLRRHPRRLSVNKRQLPVPF